MEKRERETAQSGKNKAEKIESIRMTCVGLGNSVFDLKEWGGIDMRKEVTNYFAERFEDAEGR